jgi:hypothetical protein
MREGLIEIMQTEAYAPLHVRAAAANRTLHLVADNTQPQAAATVPQEPDAPLHDGEDSGVLQ